MGDSGTRTEADRQTLQTQEAEADEKPEHRTLTTRNSKQHKTQSQAPHSQPHPHQLHTITTQHSPAHTSLHRMPEPGRETPTLSSKSTVHIIP